MGQRGRYPYNRCPVSSEVISQPGALPSGSRVNGEMRWMTPGRCRAMLAGLLAVGFAGHLLYLWYGCPIDLSGDEAHYWEWSRRLDWGYYSKGPLVAWVIRGSTAVFGHEMWAVRLPALVFAALTCVLVYGF